MSLWPWHGIVTGGMQSGRRLRIFKDSMGILSWHRGCGSKSPIYLNQESLPLAYCSIYTNPHCDLWLCYFAKVFPVYLTERKYTSLN